MEPRLPWIPAALLDGSVSIITYVISPRYVDGLAHDGE